MRKIRKRSLAQGTASETLMTKSGARSRTKPNIELQDAQRLANLGSWFWDRKAGNVLWSREMYRITGCDPCVVPPSLKEHSKFFTPDAWSGLARCLKKTLKTGAPFEAEEEIVRPDGSRIWAICRGEVVCNAKGRIAGLRGTVLDASTYSLSRVCVRENARREQAELAVSKSQEKFLKTFSAVPVAVSLVTAADGNQIEVNDALLEMTGYTRDEVIGHNFLELGYWDDPRDRQRLVEQLLRGERLSNVECRFRRKNRTLFIGLLSADLIELDGRQCIVTSVMNVTAEQQAQSELAASQGTLIAIFQSTDDAIWTVDSERFGLMMFNAAMQEAFTRTQGCELRPGMTPDDLAPPDIAKWWKHSYTKALTDGRFEVDYTALDKARTYRLSFNPLSRNGKFFGISVFARNVTGRRQAEEELRTSEERYRHLVASSSDWVWELDANLVYTYVGTQCNGILGYTQEELIGRTPFDLMPPQESQRVRQTFEAFAAERTPFRALENTNLHKDKHLVVLETNGLPIVDSEGRFCGYRCMGRDITERKRAEEALRESEGRLRLALESGRMYAYEWDTKTDVMRRSAESVRVLGELGYPLEETGTQFLGRMHADDRAHCIKTIRELTPAQDKYVTSYRELLPEAKTCWIEARGRGFFDGEGNLVRIVGIASDMTVQKESEVALRELSASLINAQEEERKRLARELHDGVSQSLALVSIEVAQAAKQATEAHLSSKLQRAYGKIQNLVTEVGHLSHELHPSTLKHLGLAAAIRFLCKEISDAHRIDIEFASTGELKCPPKDVSLCLYRVAQEALQNVIKHGKCDRARVELSGSTDEVGICVSDKGVGFDVRSHKNGLGLVSMRERLRLVGGRISIASRINAGTVIKAYVPLTAARDSAAA